MAVTSHRNLDRLNLRMFQTPEIAIEAFLPADAATAEALRQAAEAIST